MARPETGLMQFDGDWTGVFLRGDNAAAYAMGLRAVLDGDNSPITQALVRGLAATLEGFDERGHTAETEIQRLKPWSECQQG